MDSLQQLLKQVFAQIDFFNFGTITWEQFYQTYANCKKLFPSWETFEEPVVRSWPKSLHFHDTWYVKELNRLFAFDQESLSLYSLQNLQLTSERPFLQFKSFVTDLIYWPMKQFFIIGSIDKRITLYDWYKNGAIENAFETDSTPMSFAMHEDVLFTGFEDGSIISYNLSHNQQSHTKLTGHTDYVLGMQVVPELNALFSCSMDKTIKLYDIFYWKVKSTKIGHTKGVHSIAYTSSKLLFSASTERDIYVWNTFYEKPIQKLSGPHYDPIVSLRQPPKTPNLLYSTDKKGATIVWDIRKLQPVERLRGTMLEKHLCDNVIVMEDDSILLCSELEYVHWCKDSHYRSIMGKIQTILYSSIFKMGIIAHGQLLTLFHAHNLQPTHALQITEGDVVDAIFCNEKDQHSLLCISNINQVILVHYLQQHSQTSYKQVLNLQNQCKGEYRYIFCVQKLPYFLKKLVYQQSISLFFLAVTTRGHYFIFELYSSKVLHQSKVTSITKSTQVMQQILFSKSFLVFLFDKRIIEIINHFETSRAVVLENTNGTWEQICLQDHWNCVLALDRLGIIQCYSVITGQLYCQFRMGLDSQLPCLFNWFESEEESLWIGLTNGKLGQIEWKTVDRLITQQTQHRMEMYQIEEHTSNTFLTECKQRTQYSKAMHLDSQLSVMLKLFAKRLEGEEEFLAYKTWIRAYSTELEPYFVHYVDAFAMSNSATDMEYTIVMEPFTHTLQHSIRNEKQHSVSEMIDLAKFLAKGLHSLHSKGLVKGNLTSDTVVQLTTGKWKMMDVSCITDSSTPKKVEAKYIPPEMIKNEEDAIIPTKAQDIWCFGTLLYEMCFKTVLDGPITEQHLKRLEIWGSRSIKTPSSSAPSSPHPSSSWNAALIAVSLVAGAAKQLQQVDERLRHIMLNTLVKIEERWSIEQIVHYLFGKERPIEQEEQDTMSDTIVSVQRYRNEEEERMESKMIKNVEWDGMYELPSHTLYCMNKVKKDVALIGMAKSGKQEGSEVQHVEALESSFIAWDLNAGKIVSQL